jgi:homogentisate 1,2-dioxygenase
MSPHGPDSQTYEAAVDAERSSGPQKIQGDTLAFMFEVNAIPRVTPAALSSPCIDRKYHLCWEGLRSWFEPPLEHVEN